MLYLEKLSDYVYARKGIKRKLLICVIAVLSAILGAILFLGFAALQMWIQGKDCEYCFG